MNPEPNADSFFFQAFQLRNGQAEWVGTWVSSSFFCRRVEMLRKGIREMNRLSPSYG